MPYFNAGRTQPVSFNGCNKSGNIDFKIDGFFPVENSFFKMLEYSF